MPNSPSSQTHENSFFPVPVTAIILAGGASQRMQMEKSTLPVHRRPLIVCIYEQLAPCCTQVLISSNHHERYAFLGVEVVPDRVPGCGPLMGIASALARSRSEVNFVTACDIPEIDLGFVCEMVRLCTRYEGVIPLDPKGFFEPLYAVYTRRMLPRLEQCLAAGERKISRSFPQFNLAHPCLGSGRKVWNLNHKHDYAAYLRYTVGEPD